MDPYTYAWDFGDGATIPRESYPRYSAPATTLYTHSQRRSDAAQDVEKTITVYETGYLNVNQVLRRHT